MSGLPPPPPPPKRVTPPPSSSGAPPVLPPPPRSGNQQPQPQPQPQPPQRPHESFVGDFPAMESAPSSGNFARNAVTAATTAAATTAAAAPAATATTAATTATATATAAAATTPLPPPPPPPPKFRMTRALSPMRTTMMTASRRSSGSGSGSGGSSLSLPPPAAAVRSITSLPPPPKIAVLGSGATSPTGTGPPASSSSSSSPPPPPPRAALADELLSPAHGGGAPPSTTSSPDTDTDTGPDTDTGTGTDPDPVPPPRLPLTTFSKPSLSRIAATSTASPLPSLLARRQTHLPILVVATEHAQQVAWKNGLQLVDLFQGIVEQPVDHQHQQAAKNNVHLPPFRSIHKFLDLPTTASVKVQFVDPSQLSPHSYDEAHSLLQDHALIQESDGDIAQELIVLEERVEELLQDPVTGSNNSSSSNSNSNSSSSSSSIARAPPSQPQGASPTLAEATKEAFQLTSPLDIPWLVRYRQALDGSTNALPHDLIQTPALVLLVCASDEPTYNSPLDVMNELYTSQYVLPSAFRNGLCDPAAIRKEVLVLHDAVEGPTSAPDSALRAQLQSKFGPHSHVLNINSVPPATAQALAEQEDSDWWGGGGTLGNRLSHNDRSLLRRYLQQTVITSCLLPALERRIATLNAIVSERKKGVRNLVKSFWRKPKDESSSTTISGPTPSSSSSTSSSTTAATTTATTTTATATANKNSTMDATTAIVVVKYRYDSIESQTRLLADTLFLMQDYEPAFATYKLIRDDFKADKALLHYASLQEMMALCLYHMDSFGRAKEMFTCLETALLNYTRAAEEERNQMIKAAGRETSSRPPTAPHATRLATRLCLLLATVSSDMPDHPLTNGREVEVADLLASASSHESSLGAAVLLEQSSAYYYEARFFRKYAFHMLMSGHMFRTANQDHHAFRCFTSALYVYRHGQWSELQSHLKSALAAQLYTMCQFGIALQLYAKLVAGAGTVSTSSQHKFLAHLLAICTGHPKAALVGADRMAVPPHCWTRRDRDAARNAHLERIVDIVRYTPGASRVLELPYLGLPTIDDGSVRVWTHAEQHFFCTDQQQLQQQQQQAELSGDDGGAVATESIEPSLSPAPLGKIQPGLPETWKELEVLTIAEQKATMSPNNNSNRKTRSLHHQQVIAQIDKEVQTRNLQSRKKNANTVPPITMRARGEPIICEFTVQNPMNVDIQWTNVQLVAQMVSNQDDGQDTMCSNQDAIQLPNKNVTTGSTDDDPPITEWTFAPTEHQVFTVPEFARHTRAGRKNSSSSSAADSPFFVVTKQSVSLQGRDQKTITAGLTPLVEGDLEIIGVRCKLSDQVWVYHPFDIPGPLLNDTRSNRANRVRGESVVLKSKIGPDMPSLTAELVRQHSSSQQQQQQQQQQIAVMTDDGPLLHGQISAWSIRLRNVGTASTCRVTLKTNVPWINLVRGSNDDNSEDNEDLLERRATSNCIGPTGTLMTLPLAASNLATKGVLAPGESVDIPVQIRTSGSGRQSVYLLFRCELLEEIGNDFSSSKNPSPCRWLQKMYDVPVYPSLELTARVLPSFRKDNEQMLSVEMTNYRTDRPMDLYVTLDKLALTSRQYRLEPLPGQFSTSDQVANVLQIGWQERMTVHYKVIPSAESSKAFQLSECAFLENAKASTQACIKSKGATDFLCLEQAYETFNAAWKNHKKELLRAENANDGGGAHPRSIASIRRANTADSAAIPDDDDPEIQLHPTSIGALCPPELSSSRIHILCNWRAILGDEVIRGEHQLRDVLVRPLKSSKECPVSATSVHAARLVHDFSKGPAIVPLRATLRNRMVESPVQFQLAIDPSPTFEVIGLESLLVSLQADESITIPMDVLIPSAGIHDLQTLKLTVLEQGDEGDQEGSTFPLEQQWLVHVTDSTPQQ